MRGELGAIVRLGRAREEPGRIAPGLVGFQTLPPVHCVAVLLARVVLDHELEGGAPVIDAVRRLVELGVPVMGHLGFTPQSANQIGVRVQGRSVEAAAQLIRDAEALAEAGAFAIVLELVPAGLATVITERLSIPTIGIGAGAGCSGQVQVWHDLLGFSADPPFRHAGRFAEIGSAIEQGLKAYTAAVREGRFPTDANAASIDSDIVAAALTEADRA